MSYIPSASVAPPTRSAIPFRHLGTQAVGGLLGGLVGGALVEAVIAALKEVMDFFAAQPPWMLIATPLLGLGLATLALEGFGRSRASRPGDAWRAFVPGAVRRDITGDIVNTAGEEERFPWRLVPLRLVAIFTTVGLGAGMGTEAPAAYLGVGVGVGLGDRGRRWRQLLRPAALGGGAAGVAVLMGIPLVGTGYVLEIGRRNDAPYSAERVIPALIGGGVGWALNVAFDVDLIRLVVPREPPVTLTQAAIAACLIGGLSGLITSLAAAGIYRAKKWQAPPSTRLVLGGLGVAAAAIGLFIVAEPSAAFGPGGAAIVWAETHAALPQTLVMVALLRTLSTVAAMAAGGCGGVFVPFLAIGDISGRVFAPWLDVGADLAGAAGAAGGIAGGYRLPLTAIAMVLGVGGPPSAQLTCLAVVPFAYFMARLNLFHPKRDA